MPTQSKIVSASIDINKSTKMKSILAPVNCVLPILNDSGDTVEDTDLNLIPRYLKNENTRRIYAVRKNTFLNVNSGD